MPIVHVDGPHVTDVDRKRAFVRTVTEAASTLFDLPTSTIVVLIKENDPENVGVGGELVIDRSSSD